MPEQTVERPYSRIQRAARRSSLPAPARPRAAPAPAALVPVPRTPGLVERLDAARRELAAAKDDFARIRIRDGAAAIRAASRC